MSKNRFLLYLDLGLFGSFVVINVPQITGTAFHEWVSFIFIPVIILHILMKWDWIITITRRMFKRLPGETRFNHTWDALLFIEMTTVIVSGIVISRTALPTLGVPVNTDPFWLTLHHLSTAVLLATIGVHLAMHWKWIVSAANRYLFARKRTAKSVTMPEQN